jgi:hypothetical protein
MGDGGDSQSDPEVGWPTEAVLFKAGDVLGLGSPIRRCRFVEVFEAPITVPTRELQSPVEYSQWRKRPAHAADCINHVQRASDLKQDAG